MTHAKEIVEKGKRVPNWSVKDQEGNSHAVWDYRQKSHLLLIHEPGSSRETVERWQAAIQADRNQWDWLNVKILVVKQAPKDLTPGVYAIDRYGMLLNSYPSKNWNFDDLEKSFLYYEAFHC